MIAPEKHARISRSDSAGNGLTLPSRKYRYVLRDSEGCRKLLSAVINELRENKISCTKGKAIGYLVNILLKIFEADNFEERLTELERRFHYEQEHVRNEAEEVNGETGHDPRTCWWRGD